MYSELPKLLDRNFAIAYFLPVNLFLIASTWLLESTGYWRKIASRLTGNTIVDATLAIFVAWIISILLMVLNYEIYRFLEGYHKYNPLRVFQSTIIKIFRKKLKRLHELTEECVKPDPSPELLEERTELLHELAESYPDREDLLLPTPFGNTLRAFEVYPRVMYGLEGIDGWPRILAFVPKDYREQIDDAKAQVDWWVNLCVMSVLFLIEFWLVVFLKWRLTPDWWRIALNILVPLAIFALLNWFLLWRATSAAVGWGDYVKSVFDIYRFNLLETLGVDAPKTRKAEIDFWTNFSQAILFRLPDSLPKLKKTRAKGKK